MEAEEDDGGIMLLDSIHKRFGELPEFFSLRHRAQELNENYLNLFEAIPRMKVSFEPKTLLVLSREKDYDSPRRKEDLKCLKKEKYTPIVTKAEVIKADEERMNYYVLKSCLSMHANITMDPVCLGRLGSGKPTGCWYVYLVRFDDELGIEKILEKGKVDTGSCDRYKTFIRELTLSREGIVYKVLVFPSDFDYLQDIIDNDGPYKHGNCIKQ